MRANPLLPAKGQERVTASYGQSKVNRARDQTGMEETAVKTTCGLSGKGSIDEGRLQKAGKHRGEW